MNSNHFDRHAQLKIADELLSAYLDGEVTAQERAQVERALAQDPETAWRLESLQQTVTLVKALPRVNLPRSFTLREADVMPTRGAAETATPWWRSLFAPVLLRNATAIAALLLMVFLAGDLMLSRTLSSANAPVALKAPETVVVEAVVQATPAIANARAVEPLPTPTAGDSAAAQVQALPPAVQPLEAPGASSTSAAPTAPAVEVVTAVPPPAPAAGASGALVTTVPATGAPVIELMAPPANQAVAAPESSAAGRTSGFTWLRSAQIALALLTAGLFVAWRRSLQPAR